jgi:hypothetical protein
MQFGRLLVAAAASTAVQAVLELTDSTYAGITVGEPFDITWKGASGDVTLILLDDTNPNNAVPVATITSGLTGTSYAWTPSSTLINMADYAIKIVDSVTSNFGAQFQLVGGATASPTSTAGSSSATTTADTGSSTTIAESTTVQSTTSAPTSSASTPFTNSTMTTSYSSTAGSHTSATTTGPSGSQTSAPNAANSIASPLAFVLLTVAALVSLN